MRNQKGITLIALIVTIIVLIIIAGISIATLTADNGILRQTDSAKISTIEGTVREEVDLACAAVRLAIAEAQAKNNNYNATHHAKTIQDTLVAELGRDSALAGDTYATSTKDLNGATVTDPTDTTAGVNTFYISFTSAEYQNACNDANAIIIVKIDLAQSSIARTGFEGFDTSSSINSIKANEIGG